MNSRTDVVPMDGHRWWDAFWKILSMLVIPWCGFVSYGLWTVASDVRDLRTTLQLKNESYERRIKIIELQMSPEKRFYRWDGDALDQRLDELESLHPRQLERVDRPRP